MTMHVYSIYNKNKVIYKVPILATVIHCAPVKELMNTCPNIPTYTVTHYGRRKKVSFKRPFEERESRFLMNIEGQFIPGIRTEIEKEHRPNIRCLMQGLQTVKE